MTPEQRARVERLYAAMKERGAERVYFTEWTAADCAAAKAAHDALTAEVEALRREREDRQAARERIHQRFTPPVARGPNGECLCPYCARDGEALAEMAAEYECDSFLAIKRAEQAEADRAAARAEVAAYAGHNRELLMALVRHGQHEDGCAIDKHAADGGGTCDCGLDAALTAKEA